MYFNIAFDIVTLILIASIILANVIMKSQKGESSRAFITMVLLLAVSTIFDILAAITGGDVFWDSDELNIIFETIYMCTGLYCLYATFLTVAMRIEYDYRKASQVIFGLVTVYTFLLLMNIPTRLLFDIVDGVFDNHPLFYAAYSIPVFVMLFSVYIIIRKRKLLERRMFIATISASFIPILGVLIQIFNDRLILIQFGLALTILIMSFVWETPDALKLEAAVEELERTREEEAASRREAELADNVKGMFLSRLSEELARPIEEIQEYARQIVSLGTETEAYQDAEHIIIAGDRFKEILDTISKE